MKLVNLKLGNHGSLGLVTESGILSVRYLGKLWGISVPTTMERLTSLGNDCLSGLQLLVEKIAEEGAPEDAYIRVSEQTYAPIVTEPEKIVCVGLNYRCHAAEVGREAPKAPVLFSKFNNSLAAHQQKIPLPPIAECYDYEAELVIVMGKETAHITEEYALEHVLGYTIGNDLTARELQALSGQWLIGKTLDHFAPVGPYLVTADEITNPQNLNISLELNGKVRQAANTSEMIFTGTPAGVISGKPKEEQVWLKRGDRLSVRIEGIGELRNTLT